VELLAGSTRLHFLKLVKILGTSGRRAPGAVPVRPELVTLGTPVEPPPRGTRQHYSGLPATLVEIMGTRDHAVSQSSILFQEGHPHGHGDDSLARFTQY